MRSMIARARPWVAKIWEFAGAVSIRTKIFGIVLSLMVLLGVGVTFQVRSVLRQLLEQRLQEQSLSIARDVAARAADLILINDLYGLQTLLEDTQANYSDVRYGFVLDGDGRPLAHTFGVGFPLDLIEANPCLACAPHQTLRLQTDEGKIWDTAVPILGGEAGVARVGLTEVGLRHSLAEVTTQLLLITGAVTLLGLAAGGLLTWILTRPILSLVEATQAVAKGDLSQRVARWADDEIGELAEAFNQMTEQLGLAEQARAERDRLRAQLLEKVIAAQEEERKRIARELHDETGQALTSLMVGLRGLQDHCQSDEVVRRAETLRQVAVETLEGVHNLALELRPSVLDDMGLVVAVERYTAEIRSRHDLAVDFVTYSLEERLPPPVEIALYRIIQEALTNVIRHSQASTASVLLEGWLDRVRAIVEDDGRGFDVEAVLASTRRLGLYGMQERVELLGGTLTIESRPGAGTSIFVEIPLDASRIPEAGRSDLEGIGAEGAGV